MLKVTMDIKNKTLILLMAFALNACNKNSMMDEVMLSWEGTNIEEAFDQWGYSHRIEAYEGKTTYMWKSQNNKDCKRFLTINSDNIIEQWKWEGKYCPKTNISNWLKK